MSTLSNSIKNGNNNNQAARDLTVNNNHLGTLDALVMEHLSKDLIPILQKEAIGIKDSVGSQIREIINQQVINPLKRDLEIENINYHLSNLKEQLKQADYSKLKENSRYDNMERTEIVNDWIEGVEKIPPEEEELSCIWEGWYIDFYERKSTSDLQLVLNKMKNLSSKEAITLLNLNKKVHKLKKDTNSKNRKNNPSKKSLFHLFVRPVRLENRKKQYLYEQLIKKELIEKDTTHKQFIVPLLAISFVLFLLVFINQYYVSMKTGIMLENSTQLIEHYPMMNSLTQNYYSQLSSEIKTIIVLFLTLIVWSPYFFRRIKVKYQRTWIGEEIVSYAKKIEYPKNNTDIDDSIKKEN